LDQILLERHQVEAEMVKKTQLVLREQLILAVGAVEVEPEIHNTTVATAAPVSSSSKFRLHTTPHFQAV
jgi:hypothetical protein